MKFVLVFTNGASYRAHNATCTAARTTRRDTLIEPETFESVEAAQAWADRDESEKAGTPTKANFKRCPCTK